MIVDFWTPVFNSRPSTTPLANSLPDICFPNWSEFDLNLQNPIAALALDNAFKALPNSSPGLDRIPFSLVSGVPQAFRRQVERVITDLSRGHIPDNILDANLIMIKKKDLMPTPSDLRPISIPNTIIRIVQRWVAKVMGPLAQNLIHQVRDTCPTSTLQVCSTWSVLLDEDSQGHQAGDLNE